MNSKAGSIEGGALLRRMSGVFGEYETPIVHLNTGVSRSWAIIRQPSDLDSRPLKNEHPGMRRTIKYRGGID